MNRAVFGRSHPCNQDTNIIMKSVFPAGVVTFLLLALASGCGQAGQNQYTAKATADREEAPAETKAEPSAEQMAPEGAPDVELLTQIYPGLDIENMRQTEAGLWEVSQGTAYGYLTGDGRYLVQGDLVDLQSGESLTENRRNESRKQVIEQIGEAQMVTFAPEGETKHVIYVFTDVDCGYCRKLHAEIDELNELGIEVRYAAFPRGGMQSRAASVMQSVWCAEDPKAALTAAKQGKDVDDASCTNPVARQFALGQQVGVQGTPAIFLANGVMIPGYQPAAQLAAIALENQQ